MNPLAHGLPSTVNIGGREFAINTDHRVGIRFEALVLLHIPDSVKLDAALRLYFPEIPTDRNGAISALLDFHRMGKPADEGDGQRAYDFTADFDLIYASFMREYHIDLFAESLHWWAFRALLFGLSEESPFMKAVGYRLMRIPAKMERSQREFYAKMKRLHALPSDQPKMTIEEIMRAKFGADMES